MLKVNTFYIHVYVVKISGLSKGFAATQVCSNKSSQNWLEANKQMFTLKVNNDFRHF